MLIEFYFVNKGRVTKFFVDLRVADSYITEGII
jgi:hypothetical protein